MLYNMPQKVKVSGSRPLRKGSRKNSKKGSKKSSKRHTGLDFTSILNDMTKNEAIQNQQQMQQNPMGDMMQQQMGNMMQQQMGQNPMGNMMPNAFGNMMGDMSSMMGNMMMGNNNTADIDPLHIQQLIPQGQNLNINNYGISVDQLNSGEQNTGLSNRFNGMGAQMPQQMPQQMHQQMSQQAQPQRQ